MIRPDSPARWHPSPIVAVLVLAAITLPTPTPAQTGTLPWRGPFESAWAEATARARPLWVQFTSPWCVFCVRMDQETFSRDDVIAYTFNEFVPVKVRTDERPDLAERYGVTRLPATLLIAPDGRLLVRRDGYTDPGTFLALLDASRLPDPAPDAAPIARAPEDPATATLALEGYDPVALAENRGLAPGKPELVAARDGLAFRFASTATRDAFLADPERYLPRNAGRCLVSQVEDGDPTPGDPRFGVAYGGHLYVFASASARRRFAAEPERYAGADVAENGCCPHCRAVAGAEVPGRATFVSTHQGRRYLFPDATHLQAFAADPDRFVR